MAWFKRSGSCRKSNNQKKIFGKDLKLGKKKKVLKKIKKNHLKCSCNRLWNKKKYFKIFFKL